MIEVRKSSAAKGKKKAGKVRYRVTTRWRGFPNICFTTGKREDAEAYHRTLMDLRDSGQIDIAQAIANGDVDLQTVHRMAQTHGARNLTLQQLGIGVAPEPTLGELYDDWMAWLKRKGTVSPRTRRPFAPRTIRRYAEGWDLLFHFLGGRSAPPSVLTKPRLEGFAAARIDGGVAPSTVNRDLTAIESFCRWLADHRPEVTFTRPRFVKREEPKYDEQERHLEPEEIAAVREHCPPEWWVLVELLYLTGLRIGELHWLLRGDVDLRAGMLHVRETEEHRLKSRTSVRQVPIAPRAATLLRELLAGPGTPLDFVLPEELRDYDGAYRMFEAACIAAGLHDHGAAHRALLATLREDLAMREQLGEQIAPEERRQLARLASGKARLRATRSLHGLRHTFGVACARAGLHPTVIKGYMGHSSVTVTERYMRFVRREGEGQRHAQAVEAALGVAVERRDQEGKVRTPKKPQIARRVGSAPSSSRAAASPTRPARSRR